MEAGCSHVAECAVTERGQGGRGVRTRRQVWTRVVVGMALALTFGAARAEAQTPGVTVETLGRGTVAYSDVVDGPADIVVARIVLEPGVGTGWHLHYGPVWGVVNRGTLTIHEPSGCTSVYPTGTVRVEVPDDVHEGRNEGAEPVELMVTYLIPAGQPPSSEVPAPEPATCNRPPAQAPATSAPR